MAVAIITVVISAVLISKLIVGLGAVAFAGPMYGSTAKGKHKPIDVADRRFSSLWDVHIPKVQVAWKKERNY